MNPLDEEHPTVHSLHQEGRPDDGVIYYTASNIIDDSSKSTDSVRVSARRIEITIIDENDDEIIVELDVIDNTNHGMDAMISNISNYSPTDLHAEFSETITIDKSEVPYYQDDFPNVQSYIPISERVAPVAKKWSQNNPFQA